MYYVYSTNPIEYRKYAAMSILNYENKVEEDILIHATKEITSNRYSSKDDLIIGLSTIRKIRGVRMESKEAKELDELINRLTLEIQKRTVPAS